MDIVIEKIAYLGRGPFLKENGSQNRKGLRFKDRRNSKYDRRKDIRDGIIISLYNEHRSPHDRRAHL